VGTRKWLSKVDLDTPLYFDKAHKKSNLSGERYAKYSSATTVGEYKARNPGAHMANDAQYDFKHGHLRLLPLSAIPSLPLAVQRAVLAVRALLPSRSVSEVPMTIDELATEFSSQTSDVTEQLPRLRRFRQFEESGAPRDPHVVLADQLHARAHALGPHDTSMAMNLALEELG
jgi:hypothetical protein